MIHYDKMLALSRLGVALCLLVSTGLLVASLGVTGAQVVDSPRPASPSLGASFEGSRGVAFAGVAPLEFIVTVTETGLPQGASWGVVVNGSLQTSGARSLTLSLPNGTYGFTVVEIPGYFAYPSGGEITIMGSSVSQSIYFEKSYSASFTEVGLTPGTEWSVGLETYGTELGRIPLPGAGPTGFKVSSASVDSVSHRLYLAGGSQLTVVNLTSATVIGQFGIGWDSSAAAVESATHRVFVTDQANNELVVFDGVSNTIIRTVEVGSHPTAVAVDPIDHKVFVANSLSSNISVIDSTTYAVLGSIPVGGSPDSLAFVPRDATLYVAGATDEYNFDLIRVIDCSSDAIVANISAIADALAVDPFRNLVYATFTWGGLIVIDPGTRAVTAGVGLGDPNPDGPFPGGVAVEESTGNIFVPAQYGFSGYSRVTVVNYSTQSILGYVGIGGWSAGIAATDGRFYIVDSAYPNVNYLSVLSGSQDEVSLSSVTDTIGFSVPDGAYGFRVTPMTWCSVSPASGSVYVYYSNFGARITFGFPLSFTQTGLPSGARWWVSLSELQFSEGSYNSTIDLIAPNGTYLFEVGTFCGWVGQPSSGSVTVAGSDVSVQILLVPLYKVTFSETGLPNPRWEVYLDSQEQWSGVGAIVEFWRPNGTYAFSIPDIDGYVASPSSGLLSVSGPTNQSVIFEEAFTVTFAQTGLPAGTDWCVLMGGATRCSENQSITFSELNGTYHFSVGSIAGYAADPATGSVTVSGAFVNESITFSIRTFPVTFHETGLPEGADWTVTMVGIPRSSDSGDITFAEPNGTYSFVLDPLAGYVATPASGSVVVSGLPVSRTISFTALLYDVTFAETGLPTGQTWAVTLGGIERQASSTSISFQEPNGSYAYTIEPVPGYRSDSYGGTITVSSAELRHSVIFTVFDYMIGFHQTGLPTSTNWSVTLSGTTQSSSANSLIFQEPNGTYEFAVDSLPGFVVDPAEGTVNVTGNPANINVVFVPIPRAGGGFLGFSGNLGYYLLAGLAGGTAVVLVTTVLVRSRVRPGRLAV